MKKKINRTKEVLNALKGVEFKVLDSYEGNPKHILIDGKDSHLPVDVWPGTGTVRFNHEYYRGDNGILFIKKNFKNLEPSANERIGCLEERVDLLTKQLEDALHSIELLK